jgi:hypothetical protein
MKMLLILSLMLAATGCISVHPSKFGLPAGTPAPTPAQIDSCEKTRTWHNVWTMLGTVFGAGAGAGGTASAITQDKTAQEAVAISAAGSGLLAAISTTAAGIEADNYSTDNCPAILSAAASMGDQK